LALVIAAIFEEYCTVTAIVHTWRNTLRLRLSALLEKKGDTMYVCSLALVRCENADNLPQRRPQAEVVARAMREFCEIFDMGIALMVSRNTGSRPGLRLTVQWLYPNFGRWGACFYV